MGQTQSTPLPSQNRLTCAIRAKKPLDEIKQIIATTPDLNEIDYQMIEDKIYSLITEYEIVQRRSDKERPGEIDYNQETALTVAVMKGNTEVIMALLDTGRCDVNVSPRFPPLLLACYCGYIDIVKLLLSAGALVNQTNVWKQTPLMMAVMPDELVSREYFATHKKNSIAIIHLLLDAGADINMHDYNNHTALCYLSPLLQQTENFYTQREKDLSKLLIELGANVNVYLIRRPKYDSPIIYSLLMSWLCEIDMVILLLEHGANTTYLNHLNQNAAQIAHLKNYTRVEKVLINYQKYRQLQEFLKTDKLFSSISPPLEILSLSMLYAKLYPDLSILWNKIFPDNPHPMPPGILLSQPKLSFGQKYNLLTYLLRTNSVIPPSIMNFDQFMKNLQNTDA